MGKLLLTLLAVVVIGVSPMVIINNQNNDVINDTNNKVNEDTNNNVDSNSTQLSIVTSLEDKISNNSAWCGTFNLIWNDLKNEIAKQDIVFETGNQPEQVINLNKGTFTTNDLSEASYYKVYGTPSLELKEEIKKAIKEKFNETSSIIDNFDFEHASKEDYFLYSMLKKEFEFPKVFTKLPNGKFGDFDNVKFFGIDRSTDSQVRDQVEVLYYNSRNDFAVKLLTKQNDEVILTRGNTEDNFLDMYNNVVKKGEEYDGAKYLKSVDTLQVPNISFNLKEEIKDVENRTFRLSNGRQYFISTALQTIEFDLDEKGGRIKSEAGMMVAATSIAEPPVPREFIIDDTFTIFLKEEGRELPYFAAKISDISQVQDI